MMGFAWLLVVILAFTVLYMDGQNFDLKLEVHDLENKIERMKAEKDAKS